MDAITPPKLTLQKLDRDELLKVAQRFSYSITLRDLWRARWDILCERAEQASVAAIATSEVYAAIAGRDVTKLSARAFASHRREREAAWTAYQAASARAERAHAKADRAYKAFDACPVGR